MKYFQVYCILLIPILIQVSCESFSTETTTPRIVKRIADVNQNNSQLEDSIFQLYDSLSKVMWSSNDNLIKLDEQMKAGKYIDDPHGMLEEAYIQGVFRNKEKLISLDSICDSLNMPTVNFRIFLNVDDALNFVDQCIFKFDSLNTLKEHKNSGLFNQILADRERLVKMQDRDFSIDE